MPDTKVTGNAASGNADTNPPPIPPVQVGSFGLFPVLPLVTPLAPNTDVPIIVGKTNQISTLNGDQNATMPACNSVTNGSAVYIKCYANGGQINIDPHLTDTIDGVAGPAAANISGGDGSGMLMVSDGDSNWVLVLDQFDD